MNRKIRKNTSAFISIFIIYFLQYQIFYAQKSPSALENYEIGYLLVHATFLVLVMFFFMSWIKHHSYQCVIFAGMLAGIILSALALLLSTMLFLDNGLERIYNSYNSLLAVIYALLNYLIHAIYHAEWFVGVVVFSLTKKIYFG